MTKATMIICNTMGVLVVRHIRIQKAIPSDEGIILIYSMKGRKKKIGSSIKKDETSLVLVEGFQDVPVEMEQLARCKASWIYANFISFDVELFENTVEKIGGEIFYQH